MLFFLFISKLNSAIVGCWVKKIYDVSKNIKDYVTMYIIIDFLSNETTTVKTVRKTFVQSVSPKYTNHTNIKGKAIKSKSYIHTSKPKNTVAFNCFG